jgi:hypothetical protein
MEPIDPFAQLPDVERERLYRVKKAVAEGTYAVSVDALAAKLLDSMLEAHANRSLQITDSLQTEVQALLLDQKNG